MSIESIRSPQQQRFIDLPDQAKPLLNLDPENVSLKKEDALVALSSLPYVDLDLIERHRGAEVTRMPNVEFPVGRIISTKRAIDGWGSTGTKSTYDGRNVSSIDLALEFARNNIDNPNQPVKIELFQDDAGEYWGIVDDGTHRVMAAKVKAQDYLAVELSVPKYQEGLARYRGDVIAEVSNLSQVA
jgi:hypothetical protein